MGVRHMCSCAGGYWQWDVVAFWDGAGICQGMWYRWLADRWIRKIMRGVGAYL